MKIPSVLNNLLTKRIVLNIITIVAFLNMIGYLITGKITPVLLFVVLAILITHFSRNMIIILGIPLFVVNLFVMNYSSDFEGMENNEGTHKNAVKAEAVRDNNNTSRTNNNSNTNDNRPEGRTNQGLPKTAIVASSKKNDESFEVGRAKKSGGYNIDYASTIEDAYDELNNILGSDGIKRLTDDTQKLMKQQMQLSESMSQMGPMIKNMEPMMNQAKQLLEGMGDNNGGISGIMEMAKKFGGTSEK